MPEGRPRRGRAAALLLLIPLLSGCVRREQPGWPVLDLPDAGLPRLGEVALARCAARLGLPPELPRPADPTNFGERRRADVYGRPLPHQPRLIVLHETVMAAPDTVALFQTPHRRDEDQVSYHLLVDRSGRRLRFVPDRGRAYGAGVSAFGDMTVRVNARSPGSINDVALHLSLESPPDGRGDAAAHSGYSPAQYRAAAAQVLLWQLRWGIPMGRVTTHAAVDRSHSRYDPRSFRWDRFDAAHGEAARRCGQDPAALARLPP